MRPVPATIRNHPGVLAVHPTTDDVIDYKWEVELRPGWAWAGGRNQGGRYLFVNRVREFLAADPQPVEGA